MFVRTLITAIAVIAIPVAVVGEEPAAPKARDDSARRICTINTTLGTRLGNTRVCRTKAERDQLKTDARHVVERVQEQRVLQSN